MNCQASGLGFEENMKIRISFFGLAAAAFSLVSCPNRIGEISAVSVMAANIAANIAAMAIGLIGVRGFPVNRVGWQPTGKGAQFRVVHDVGFAGDTWVLFHKNLHTAFLKSLRTERRCSFSCDFNSGVGLEFLRLERSLGSLQCWTHVPLQSPRKTRHFAVFI